MIRSELILPLRIYDDLYDQYRFNRLCNEQVEENFEEQILFASDALPFFQFTRQASLYIPTRLTLRNVCVDAPSNFYKIVPFGADRFVPTQANDFYGAFPKIQSFTMNDASEVQVTIAAFNNCGGISNGNLGAIGDRSNIASSDDLNDIQFSGVLAATGDILYRLKINVENFVRSGGSTFKIKIWNGNAGQYLVKTIEAAGVYVVDFIALYDGMTIGFENIADGDEYTINYLQVTKVAAGLLSGSLDYPDTDMDETKIKIVRLANGTDVVTYCESAADYNPQPGTYYYIIELGQEVYFSELFTVKDAIDLEKYYCLEWGNLTPNCDLGNIIYTLATLSSCSFFHKMYFDSALFNPEFETEVEDEPNGEGDKNILHKRWKKSIQLDLPKCPPFLTDALSAIFMHNYCALSWPLNEMQDVRNDAVVIERVSSEISDTLKNCYQAVKLILTYADKYTATNCCDAVEEFDCPAATAVADGGFSPVVGSPGVYVIFITTAVPGSSVVLHYNLNGGGYVADLNAQSIVDADGNAQILFDTNGIGAITTLTYFVRNRTITCTFNDTTPGTIAP